MSEELAQKEMALEWFVNKIRMRLLDKAQLNELIGREEIGGEEIKSSIEDTVSEFNEMDPPGFTYSVWDFPAKEILIIGTMSKLLLSGAILHWRNHLTYSAGGLSVDTHSMGPHYERLGQMYKANFDRDADSKKRQINVSSMLGGSGSGTMGLGSDYGLLSWYSRRLT